MKRPDYPLLFVDSCPFRWLFCHFDVVCDIFYTFFYFTFLIFFNLKQHWNFQTTHSFFFAVFVCDGFNVFLFCFVWREYCVCIWCMWLTLSHCFQSLCAFIWCFSFEFLYLVSFPVQRFLFLSTTLKCKGKNVRLLKFWFNFPLFWVYIWNGDGSNLLGQCFYCMFSSLYVFVSSKHHHNNIQTFFLTYNFFFWM